MIPCNFLFFNNDIQLLEMLSIANIRFKYREDLNKKKNYILFSIIRRIIDNLKNKSFVISIKKCFLKI